MRASKVDINPFGQLLHLPLSSSGVRAGFAGSADDHVESLVTNCVEGMQSP